MAMYDVGRMWHWLAKRKSFLITIGIVLLLFAAFGIPNVLPPRFEWTAVPLAVRVRVLDQERGTPIQGAVVQAVSVFQAMAVSDADGNCEAIARFPAEGILGRSGRMHLRGTMTVTAEGFKIWERSFVSLFGPHYDYFSEGTSVTCSVTLVR